MPYCRCAMCTHMNAHPPTLTWPHTHTHIYIYIYIYYNNMTSTLWCCWLGIRYWLVPCVRYIGKNQRSNKTRTWSGIFTPLCKHVVKCLAQFWPFWTHIHPMWPGRSFFASSPMWGNKTKDFRWYVMQKWCSIVIKHTWMAWGCLLSCSRAFCRVQFSHSFPSAMLGSLAEGQTFICMHGLGLSRGCVD